MLQPPAQVRLNRARLDGPWQESETSIVVMIRRTLKPTGSEGRALVPLHHSVAKDLTMAGVMNSG